jgi:magnesium-transporting ATPase (P-type)
LDRVSWNDDALLFQTLIADFNPLWSCDLQISLITVQGPSPDEVALVECARTLGFEFVSRSATHTTLSILGEQHSFETLEVMEFSSERQRMSVIVRCPDGTIKLFCKGADAMMLKRVKKTTSEDLLDRVNDNLHYFATKGLRTLVIGTRVIREDFFADWERRYDEAQGRLSEDAGADEKARPYYRRNAKHPTTSRPF